MNKYFLFALLFLFSFFISCSLFEPRVPEYPSEAGVVWITPISPEIVVLNLEAALNGSSALYLDCLSESFVFYADTNDINEYPTYNFNDWIKSVEAYTVTTALFAIVPADSSISASFLEDLDHPDPAAPVDSAIIYREYAITVPQSYYSGTGTPASGIVEFHMIENEDGFWSINKWFDLRHEETYLNTWAVAKAYYR